MRYRLAKLPLKCDEHNISVSFSDVKKVFHRTNVSIWNEYGPWTEDINVTNVVT